MSFAIHGEIALIVKELQRVDNERYRGYTLKVVNLIARGLLLLYPEIGYKYARGYAYSIIERKKLSYPPCFDDYLDHDFTLLLCV